LKKFVSDLVSEGIVDVLEAIQLDVMWVW